MDKAEHQFTSRRTKLLFLVYLASGLAGLLMVLWLALVLLTSSLSDADAALPLSAGFLFPWLPISVLTMLMAKFAMLLSLRKDRSSRAN